MQGDLLECPLIVVSDDDRAEIGIYVVVGLVLEEELFEEALLHRSLESRAAKVSHGPHERCGSRRLPIYSFIPSMQPSKFATNTKFIDLDFLMEEYFS